MAEVERPLVLIAEDDEDVLSQATQLFEDAGFRVRGASHGGKAIEALEDGLDPVAIVIDLMMPIVSGWDLWDWLQQSRFARVPVIIWTATGLRQGAVGNARILSKSVDPRVLLDTVVSAAAA